MNTRNFFCWKKQPLCLVGSRLNKISDWKPNLVFSLGYYLGWSQKHWRYLQLRKEKYHLEIIQHQCKWEKNKGPRTEPRGTPAVTDFETEYWPLRTTRWHLFFKNDSISLKRLLQFHYSWLCRGERHSKLYQML